MERIKRERARRSSGRLWRRLMPKNALTRRWLRNGFSLIVLALLVLQVLFTVMLRYYYLQSVENALESRAQLYHRTLEAYWGAEALLQEDVGRDIIALYSDKDKIELQVLDAAGQIRLSSTGFANAAQSVPDYSRALLAADGLGLWRGALTGGESAVALTCLERDAAGEPIGALRYVVSLEAVEGRVWFLSLLLLGFMLVVVLFVSLSGTYFINSIITPVAAVNKTARRIAMGEYGARLEKRYNDEIGELCDTINFMAGEISHAEEMKFEFISSVSHELRTPLTAIKGWTETLQSETGDAALTAHGLSVIGKEAARLTGLVEELLDFSRMESNHIHLRWERLDVSAELQEAAFLLQDKAQRTGVRLDYVPCGALPPVRGDTARIKQVFVNLLDNAVKYSRPGDRVRVEAAVMPDGVQVVISDTGVGIAPDQLPLVTRKFYQARPGEAGAGIGLAVADEILRLHGGRLELDSELGVGTTATVWLPLNDTGKDTMG